MHVDRKETKAIAETYLPFNNLADYISRIITIYSGAEIDRELWLTPREHTFFISTAIHVLNGISNPISEDAIQIYENYFNKGVKKRDIISYINKLRKKGWAKYSPEKKCVYINPIIENIDLEMDRMDFRIRLDYEKHKTERDGESNKIN